jgi:hypothetical protein
MISYSMVFVAVGWLSTADPALTAAPSGPAALTEPFPMSERDRLLASVADGLLYVRRLSALGARRSPTPEVRDLSSRVLADADRFTERLRRYGGERGLDLDRFAAAVAALELSTTHSVTPTLLEELRIIVDPVRFERAYLNALQDALGALAALVATGRDAAYADVDLRPITAAVTRQVTGQQAEAARLLGRYAPAAGAGAQPGK